MVNLKHYLTSRTLDKEYRNWLKNNPEAMNENQKILKEIGNLLNKEISEGEFFYEVVTISPSDYRTNQIVIKASHGIIQLLDKFLLDKGIVACKEEDCLRIDC